MKSVALKIVFILKREIFLRKMGLFKFDILFYYLLFNVITYIEV